MELTEELESKILVWRQEHNNRMPRNDRVSKWAKCSIFEADQIINEYRRRYGLRIRRNGEDVGTQGEELPFADTQQDTGTGTEAKGLVGTAGHDRKWYDAVIVLFKWIGSRVGVGGDILALIIAAGVDLIFNAVFFQFIAVDNLTRFGFSAIVFLIVYFKVRSLTYVTKEAWGWGVLYTPLMLVTLFGGTSFALLDIEYQATHGDASKDSAYVKLLTDVEDKKATEADLQRQYREATKRETMDQLFTLWQAAIGDRKASELVARLYLEVPHIEAKKAFTAIEECLEREEYTQFAFVFTIFLSIEACVIASVIFIRDRKKKLDTSMVL